MITKKLDENLKRILVASTQNSYYDCLVYVRDIGKFISYVNKNNICKVLKKFNFINALECRVSPNNLIKLASIDYVGYVSSQSCVTALVDKSRKILIDHEINLTGKNVNICFIDTGIATHLDFTLKKNKIVKFLDLYNDVEIPYDDNGHGTFVSSVASGSGLLSNGKYKGIAPNSYIISIKALDRNGEASATKILDAMQWVYDNYKKYDIKIVCMSFGSEPLGYNDPIMKGAEALWNKGVVVVAAAGNSGPKKSTIKSPGISSRVITVGALDDHRAEDNDLKYRNFDIAEFSSRGPAFRLYKPDIVAPAVDICCCSYKGGYTKLSGTSVATPMIAGIVALILECKPKLKPDSIKRLILSSCKPITFDRNLEGYGYPVMSEIVKKINYL